MLPLMEGRRKVLVCNIVFCFSRTIKDNPTYNKYFLGSQELLQTRFYRCLIHEHTKSVHFAKSIAGWSGTMYPTTSTDSRNSNEFLLRRFQSVPNFNKLVTFSHECLCYHCFLFAHHFQRREATDCSNNGTQIRIFTKKKCSKKIKRNCYLVSQCHNSNHKT